MAEGVRVETDHRRRSMLLMCDVCDVELTVDLRASSAGHTLMRFSLEHDHAEGLDREMERARLDLQVPPR